MSLPQAIYRFLLIPGTVGLICYGCGAVDETVSTQVGSLQADSLQAGSLQADSLEPVAGKDKNLSGSQTGAGFGESASSNEESAVLEEALATQTDAYETGVSLASSAYSLSQSAVSPDDWGLVASRWQRAVEQLERVDDISEHYSVAQTKIPEYAANAQYAKEQVSSLQAAARAPLPGGGRRSLHNSQQSARVATPQPSARQNAVQPSPSLSASQQRSQPQSSRANNLSVSVPIVRRLHGTPVVQVTFNDAKAYEMILDTGASRTLITRRMANELGIAPTGTMTAATASATQVTFDLGEARSISVGSVRLNDAQVSIGDSVNIGLLGNDFLQGYDVTIRNSEVELTPSR